MQTKTGDAKTWRQMSGISARIAVAMLGILLLSSSMIAIGYSRAEDEGKPRGQVPLGSGFAAPGVDLGEGVQKGQIPRELIDKIQNLLQKQAFDGKVIVDERDPKKRYEFGHDFIYEYRCRKYHIHGSGGHSGGYTKQRREVAGPTQDGFRLEMTWRDSWTGYASEDGFGRIQPMYYWYRYINHYKMPDNQGYIRLDWDLGSHADREILADVRAELEAIGTPVAKEPPDGWEQQVEKLQLSLTDILNKRQPKAKWRRDGESLVCEYKTQEYDIHTVGEDGDVAPDAHREVGPQHEGFVIRLSRHEDVAELQGNPQYGRTDGPYWKRFFATYDHGPVPFRLDLQYGWGADKKVLEEVTAALENPNIPPERF